MTTEKISRFDRKNLKRVLGLGDLFAVGYGDVGSSIYYALGATALFALGATPLAMALAGFVFVCTALSYAELSSTFPEPGGSATFTRYAFNDLISFIAGWGLLLDYVVTMAISAFAIPPYLKHILMLAGISPPVTVVHHLVVTVSILMVLYVINLVGVKYSGRLSFFLALMTILTQVFVVGFGLLFLSDFPKVWSQIRIGVPGAAWSPDWGQFLKGTAMAMVAYTGIEAITQLAGETKKPSVLIPRAIKLTIVTLFFLYFGISVVGMSVLSPELLGTRYLEDPIAGIVAHFPFGGTLLAPWVGLVAGIILLLAANAGLLGCSRLTFSMGEYYQVPSALYRTHSKFKTPYISLGFFTLLGIAVVLSSRGKMLFLADLYNIGAQIAFLSAHLALLVLRVKKPELPRPYKAPFNIPIGKGKSLPLTAIIGALANVIVLCIVLVTKPEGRYCAIAWMALGLGTYFYYRRKRGIAAMGQLQVQKVKLKAYAPLHFKNILVLTRVTDNAEAIQTACQLAKAHSAKLTGACVVEIPYSLPMDVPLGKREALAEESLNRAQAVAEEYHLPMHLELVRARSVETAVESLVETGNFDLIVIGVMGDEFKKSSSFLNEAKSILIRSSCKVIFCRS